MLTSPAQQRFKASGTQMSSTKTWRCSQPVSGPAVAAEHTRACGWLITRGGASHALSL